MGLRHRTAISALRMQRRIAELKSLRLAGPKRLHNTKHVRFSQIDTNESHRLSPFGPHLHRKDQDNCVRLIQRLRLALQPHSEQERLEHHLVSQEYQSLQDELLRLAQHQNQQKNRNAGLPTLTADLVLPVYLSATDEPLDAIPYRTIKIVATLGPDTSRIQPKRIEKLDCSLSDLTLYRQMLNLPTSPGPQQGLSLVPDKLQPGPEAQDLLIDEEVELGHAMANLTQQSLEVSRPHAVKVSIPTEVALSLLDS